MHAIFIGASVGCGFYSVVDLLNSSSAKDNQLTLLLRTPSKFLESPEIKSIFEQKPQLKDTVKIVQGDALKEADIERLFKEAGAEKVEWVVSSIGGKPDFSNPLSPTISPTPQITQLAMKSIISQFQGLSIARKSQKLSSPRLITVSSMGLGKKGHKDLPFMLKFMYGTLLRIPHEDKLEMEKIIFGASGTGNEEIDFKSHDNGWLEDFIVIRPSLLTDGKLTASYRAAEKVPSAYSISRKDVGHFIATRCVPGNDEFKNRAIVVSN